ncbi:hypothetical protein B0G57_11820 [Trinickia symbiotica]|nr:hypothetical protein B0G57_11820 [Trinickia symbiotica]
MCNTVGLASALLAGLVCAAPVIAQTYEGQPLDTSVCRDVSGQEEIDGVMQPYTGRACQQPDGTWVVVNSDGQSWLMPDYAYDYGPYYYGPWYFGPPVLFGGSVVFLDFHRHHHHHRFDHDRFGHHFDHDFDRDRFSPQFDHAFDRGRFDHRRNHIAAMPSGVPPAQRAPNVAAPPAGAEARHVLVVPPSVPAQAPHVAVMQPSPPVQAPHTAVMRPSVPVQAPHTAVIRPTVPAQAGHMWTGGFGGVREGGHVSGGAGGHFTGRGVGGGMHGH